MSLINPEHRPVQQYYLLGFVLVSCLSLLPQGLNSLGFDFGLDVTSVNSSHAGVYQALFEWGAASLAGLAALLALVHFVLHRQLFVLLLAIVLLSYFILDSVSGLVASGLLRPNVDLARFSPFSWAMARSWVALTLIGLPVVCGWFLRRESIRSILLLSAGYLCFVMAVSGIGGWALLHAYSLPETIYADTFISRPYDVLPLSLYVLMLVLYSVFFRKYHSPMYVSILFSLIPAISAQLYMSLASVRMFDNAFFIAHALKFISSAILAAGVLVDLAVSVYANRHLNRPVTTQVSVVSGSKQALSGSKLPARAYREAGAAKRPLGVQISLGVFFVALLTALVVGKVYYTESEQFVQHEAIKALRKETQLLGPLTHSLFNEVKSDVSILSQSLAMQAIMSIHKESDAAQDMTGSDVVSTDVRVAPWLRQTRALYSKILLSKQYYHRIRYIEVGEGGRDIVNVYKSGKAIVDSVTRQAGSYRDDEVFQGGLELSRGGVYFSRIALLRENGMVVEPQRPLMQVVSPVYGADDHTFGLVVIDVDFGVFTETLLSAMPTDSVFFLANKEGDYLIHPDMNMTYGFDLGDEYRMQNDFSQLAGAIASDQDQLMLKERVGDDGEAYVAYYSILSLASLGIERPFRVLLIFDNAETLLAIESIRNRSWILSLSLSLILMCLSLLVLRYLIEPLRRMTKSVSAYEAGGELNELPLDSKDEIGVLARAFNNLFAKIEENTDKLASAKHQAEETSERIEAILSTAADAIITIDDSGTILSFNRAAEHVFQYAPAEVVGENISILMPSEIRERSQKYIQRYLKSGQRHVIGMTRQDIAERKDGERFPVELAVSEVKTEQGAIFTGFIRDVSESKKAERALREAKLQAEESTRLKSEFLANMSHEIRTPMNGVLGMLGLMQRGELNEQQQRYAGLAISSAESLLTLINDILDFSKIEAGKLDLELVDFNLISSLNEFADTYGYRAQEKGLEFILDVDCDVPIMVKGDPGRIRQILTNLVGNAIKFTDQGEVLVKVSLVGQQDKMISLCFSVKDTGIGIAQDKQQVLFDTFTQVDASTTRRYGGTGLGLAISRQLAQLMHGDIGLKSQEGEGSEFWVTAELELSETPQAVLPKMDLAGKHVLIVDDNATNREVLSGVLANWNVSCEEAEGGPQALKLLEQSMASSATSPRFDLAILDMQMPDMDGAELGRLIRKNEQFGRLPLVMMTSLAMRGDAESFADIGFSAYFTKPAKSADLYDALVVVLDGGEALAASMPLVTHHSVRSMRSVNEKLLLVEDNLINQEVALGVLEDLGYQVDVANNGVEALSMLADSLATYQLVLMDCQMPEMDGYEATGCIRRGDRGVKNPNIPIVAMTANAMKGDREKCINAGMDDYITKPVDSRMLERVLNSWLHKDDHAQSANKAAEPPSVAGLNVSEEDQRRLESSETVDQKTVSQESGSVAESLESLLVWDQSAVMERLRGREDRLLKLIDMFARGMPERLIRLSSSVKAEDWPAVGVVAHEIKGVVANLGGLRVHKLAYAMEKSGKAGDGEQTRSLMPLMQQEFDLLSDTLAQQAVDLNAKLEAL
jgi:PAS domain S-box-containing protein